MIAPVSAPAAEALNSTDGSSKELIAKVLIRMTLFGSLPPSILPMLVSVRVKVDLPKTADRKLLRVVNYLIQLAAGEGSAGTVVPFSTLVGKDQGSNHLAVRARLQVQDSSLQQLMEKDGSCCQPCSLAPAVHVPAAGLPADTNGSLKCSEHSCIKHCQLLAGCSSLEYRALHASAYTCRKGQPLRTTMLQPLLCCAWHMQASRCPLVPQMCLTTMLWTPSGQT